MFNSKIEEIFTKKRNLASLDGFVVFIVVLTPFMALILYGFISAIFDSSKIISNQDFDSERMELINTL